MRSQPQAAPTGVASRSCPASLSKAGVSHRLHRLRRLVRFGFHALVLTVGSVSSSHALVISALTLPEGNQILQVSDAVANNNPGGQASSATRTLYVFAPDFGDLDNADAGDDGPDFPGANPSGPWPWVYAPAADTFTLSDLVIEDGISAQFELRTNPNSGALLQWLYVNGNPTYQFIGDGLNADPSIPLDQDSSLANGNFGPWNYLELDGTPTQSRVPVPSTLFLLLAGVIATRRFSR